MTVAFLGRFCKAICLTKIPDLNVIEKKDEEREDTFKYLSAVLDNNYIKVEAKHRFSCEENKTSSVFSKIMLTIHYSNYYILLL